MIVQLKEPVLEKTNNYAYACEPGTNYFVYAMLEYEGGAEKSYMINVWGENGNDTIYDIPSKYFKVIDDSIPKNWAQDSYMHDGKKVHIWSFPEMARSIHFYSKLMDNDPETLSIFKRYQAEYERTARELKHT